MEKKAQEVSVRDLIKIIDLILKQNEAVRQDLKNLRLVLSNAKGGIMVYIPPGNHLVSYKCQVFNPPGDTQKRRKK